MNYGANPYTSIAARSMGILADLDRMRPAWPAPHCPGCRVARTSPQDPAAVRVSLQSDSTPDRPSGMRMSAVGAWLATVELDQS